MAFCLYIFFEGYSVELTIFRPLSSVLDAVPLISWFDFGMSLWFFLGQIIPKGLHVRLNLETGEKEAKLMDDEGVSGSHESAGNILILIIYAVSQKMSHLVFAHNFDLLSTDFHNFWQTYAIINSLNVPLFLSY